MNTAPVEPSRRSRREARETRPEQTRPEQTQADEAQADTAQAGETAPVRASRRADASSGERAPVSGWWKPLAIAGAALVVGLVVGLLVTVAFDGAAGHSLGGVLASVVVGGTGIALLTWYRPAGFLRLRALDVLWAIVLGAIMPFIAGVFAGGGGWPAFAALSPRWLILGVAAPFIALLMLTFFATGLVYALTLRAAASLAPLWSRVAAGAAAAIAFAIVPLVFRGDVSGMPVALPVVLGVALAVFVGLSQRLWGPVLMSLVFTAVWVALSVAGYVLA